MGPPSAKVAEYSRPPSPEIFATKFPVPNFGVNAPGVDGKSVERVVPAT